MAFPHPQARKDRDRNEHKPSRGGVVWNFVKRTVDIAEYRNAEDEVNPAKNRTFGDIFHLEFVLLRSAIPLHLLCGGCRDYGRRHGKLVVVVPGRPDRPPYL